MLYKVALATSNRIHCTFIWFWTRSIDPLAWLSLTFGRKLTLILSLQFCSFIDFSLMSPNAHRKQVNYNIRLLVFYSYISIENWKFLLKNLWLQTWGVKIGLVCYLTLKYLRMWTCHCITMACFFTIYFTQIVLRIKQYQCNYS